MQIIHKHLKNISTYIRKYPIRLTIWISLAVVTSINISYEHWNHEYKIIAHDINSYYAYLPIVFIHNDIDMNFFKEDPKKHIKHFWPVTTPIGKKAIITSMGLAYLYMPFFLGGHLAAHIFGFETDGFSAPYKIALIISCLFYLTIGLWFLSKVLRKYYSKWIAVLTLILILFGTNLLHYTTDEPTMSHAYTFALISVLMYCIIKWFESPGWKNALLVGALTGLIVLIRPINITIILLLIFWDVITFRDIGNRIRFYLRRSHLVLIMIAGYLIVWAPQLIYWKYTSGEFFYNPYKDVGARFFFDNPQIFHVLFSYRKGWFIYTPLMFITIAGFYFLYRDNRKLFLTVLTITLLNLYLISSWWCWWYGGGFGQRPLVDSYGILALPLAALLAITLKQKAVIKYFLLLVFAAILFLNTFQTVQYKRGIIHYVMMTKRAYWTVFLSLEIPRIYWDFLVWPDYLSAKQGKYYTENEILLGLQNELGTDRRGYISNLVDTISNQQDQVNIILQNNKNTDISVDSLIYLEAAKRFDQIVKDYNEKKNY